MLSKQLGPPLYAPTSTQPAPQKRRPASTRALAGGLSTKIHLPVDARGNPLRGILTGGEVADMTQAQALIEGLHTQAVIGDKGYDAEALVAYIQAIGAAAVIPPRSHRTEHRAYDRHIYTDRNVVDRFLNRLKPFRRMPTRYEKLARNVVSLLNVVCAYIWLA